jgi:hypothetical protein
LHKHLRAALLHKRVFEGDSDFHGWRMRPPQLVLSANS